jgi:hypothetical protein
MVSEGVGMTDSNALARSAETAGRLRSLRELEGFKISATDGNIGKVHDFYVDDEFWILRHVVVNTGPWLPRRKVLLSPGVLLEPDWHEHSFDVALTRGPVRTSPDIDTDSIQTSCIAETQYED